MALRILVTGSRYYDDEDQMRSTLLLWASTAPASEITIVHGDQRGADKLADKIAKELGMQTEGHPAKWEIYKKFAGNKRNQEMVDLGAYVCLGFPIGESPGTRDCMARARKADIPVYNITE